MGEKPVPNEIVDPTPLLSPMNLVWSYITDSVFAFLVFVVFLLVTWGMHYIGNALGMTWFRFSWRVLELLLISFGTLLCVLFFLKASAEFVKELIRRPQKPIKQVARKSFRLQPRDIAMRFCRGWREHRIGLVICSSILLAVLYVGISFAELVQSNCDAMSMLACELICETGPDFTKPVDPNYLAETLEGYARYIEKKHLSILLKVFPNYSPKQVLADINEILLNAKGSQEEVAHHIWRAGEEVMLFRLKAPKLFPSGIAFHEYRRATESLLPLAKDALRNSNEASEQFNNTPTLQNGVHSCECNRLTMLLLFPLWASCDRPEVASLFTDFQAVVEKCRKSKIEVAGLLPEDDPRKEFLEEIIARSEKRRLQILGHIKNRNIKEAIERMWDAIEQAYSERPELLELCARIRSGGDYSEEIRKTSS